MNTNKICWFKMSILVCGIVFLIGICLPVLHVTQLFVFHDDVSILSGLVELIRHGEMFLFLIITLFSVVFPIAKLAWLYAVSQIGSARKTHKIIKWLEICGRWSMLDVFVVTQFVVLVKMGKVADVELGVGLYCFVVSIIGMMLLTSHLKKIHSVAT